MKYANLLNLWHCFQGALALYDAADDGFQLIRMLPNTVVIGGKFGPHVLSVSEDSLKLAYIGPTEFTVTVANARSLDEVRLATQLIVVTKRTGPELERIHYCSPLLQPNIFFQPSYM